MAVKKPLSPNDPRVRITKSRIAVWIMLVVAGSALIITGIVGIVSKS